jgi:hypothetical protein
MKLMEKKEIKLKIMKRRCVCNEFFFLNFNNSKRNVGVCV